MTQPLLELRDFWSKVNKDGPIPPHKPELGPCWIWIGKLRRNGYGVCVNIALHKEMRAHRASYFMAFGYTELPVCHHCDNPPCIRPSHLFAAPQWKNIQDAIDKGRMNPSRTMLKLWETTFSKTQIGEGGNGAILKEHQVREIFRLRTEGLTRRKVAAMFNVSESAVRWIDTGRNWKHLKLVAATLATSITATNRDD